MAHTFATSFVNYEGVLRAVYGQFTFTATYPTGGESFDFRTIGFSGGRIVSLSIESLSDGYAAKIDYDNNTLKLFQVSGNGKMTEVPNGTNVAGTLVQAIVKGS